QRLPQRPRRDRQEIRIRPLGYADPARRGSGGVLPSRRPRGPKPGPDLPGHGTWHARVGRSERRSRRAFQMTLAPAHALRLGACLILLLLSGVAGGPARAQQAAAEQNVPAYQDRYIADGTLKPDVSAGDALSSDTGGLPRALRVDAVASVIDQS